MYMRIHVEASSFVSCLRRCHIIATVEVKDESQKSEQDLNLRFRWHVVLPR